jgi:hypothetical protein
MAVSGKYGKLNITKIGADEPVFILRAQDKLAEAAIDMYRALAVSHGRQLASSLQKEIDAFKKWPGAKKMPD